MQPRSMKGCAHTASRTEPRTFMMRRIVVKHATRRASSRKQGKQACRVQDGEILTRAGYHYTAHYDAPVHKPCVAMRSTENKRSDARIQEVAVARTANSIVFKCKYRGGNGGFVAVKCPTAVQGASASFAVHTDFARSQAACLHHDNIVRYIALRADNSLVMEYVDGGSLADEIADPLRGQLSVERVVRVTLHVLRGMQFMHAHGLVHRDIKPANVLIDKRANSFRLCDWIGEEEEKVHVEQTGRPVGTPVFLAPEVARSPHRHCAEGKSDIWALGCTVLNLVTGRLPWEGTDAHGRTNEFMVMFKTAYGHTPPMVTPDDPRKPDQPLAHFLGQCLDPDAIARPHASTLLHLSLFQEHAATTFKRHSLFPVLPGTSPLPADATAM